MSLGNVSTQFSVTNMVITGLFGDVYDFSIDYQPISTNSIHDIHRYLMKKKTILYKMFNVIKNINNSINIKYKFIECNSKCISTKNQEYQ